MIDHLMLRVRDAGASTRFYDGVLATLGFSRQAEYAPWIGYGPKKKPVLWIGVDGEPHTRVHLAFVASDRKAVDAFHAQALKLGGKDNGKPGVRPQYHPDYYGAFVFDPDGNNVEAVCHAPAAAPRKASPRAGGKSAAKKSASGNATTAKAGAFRKKGSARGPAVASQRKRQK